VSYKNIHLVIPAAGLGTRFRNAGFDVSKPLIEIAGIPMINWVIGNFPLFDGDSITVVSRKDNPLDELAKKWFKTSELKVNFFQIDQLSEGPADTVRQAVIQADKSTPLIVANSDQYVTGDLGKFVDSVRNNTGQGQILTMNAKGNKWSYVTRDEKGLINLVVEKKEISNEATVGIYGWNSTELFLESFLEMEIAQDRVNNEFYVAPTYNYLVKQGCKIEAFHIGDVEHSVHGLGTPEDLEIFCAQDFLETESKRIFERVQ
jgi:UDP-N-acetylglucosamine diphosphorylase / glucose-1-phosphate thymidylyltransferase / UDP-N-acetylgalactosamine diphosphorylase / glucosamine-1-phosphate N-acetyltransferase / galactosamine-1-phosphate N-acetyltransferase